MGYIRFDISACFRKECFLIPTISINKWAKGYEISIYFLWFIAYISTSYIREEDYEP